MSTCILECLNSGPEEYPSAWYGRAKTRKVSNEKHLRDLVLEGISISRRGTASARRSLQPEKPSGGRNCSRR